jgi:hypothetical protein
MIMILYMNIKDLSGSRDTVGGSETRSPDTILIPPLTGERFFMSP